MVEPAVPTVAPVALSLTLALLSALLSLLLLRRYAHRHTPPSRGGPPPLLGTGCVARVQSRGGANGCLLVPFRLGAYESSFVLDTGYAGAPVLNARLLGASRTMDETALRALLAPPHDAAHTYRLLQAFVQAHRCASYTSGCVLRLMGIGTTAEQVSDLLLCPPLELAPAHGGGGFVQPRRAVGGAAQADVLITNGDMASLHTLTLDYLLQLAPCHLRPRAGELHLGLSALAFARARVGAVSASDTFAGGSYVSTVTVDGVALRCTVDTGASTTLCVDARRLPGGLANRGHIVQVGINSETVCSDVSLARIEFAGVAFEGVPVFANATGVEAIDGYVGLGLLRAFDLLMTPRELFATPNGDRPSGLAEYAAATHKGECSARRGGLGSG